MQLMAKFRVKTDLISERMRQASAVRSFRRADVERVRDERRKVAAVCGIWQRLKQNVNRGVTNGVMREKRAQLVELSLFGLLVAVASESLVQGARIH